MVVARSRRSGIGLRSRRSGIGLLAAAALGLSSAATSTVAPPAADAASGRYIVVLRDEVDAQSIADEHGRSHALRLDHVYAHAVKGYSAHVSAEHLAHLKADPRVASVSEDRPVRVTGTVPLRAGDAAPTGVRRIEAGSSAAVQQASSVSVAVIDTGIDLSHPDLNVANGVNCVRPRRTAQDDHGHGTHVAGSIAARNNGAGVVGVAPGTKLYAVKVLDAFGSGTISQVICGIDWVTQNAAALNIKVANMSLGGPGASDNNCGNSIGDPLHAALCRSTAAGVTYVVAAGNDGSDLAQFTPAAYPEALTVTAMADSDGAPGGAGGAPACRPGAEDEAFASFSNFAVAAAEINHTVAGPGVCIRSTWPNRGYATLSGTSMASPHVAGAVALCLGSAGAAGPCTGLSPAQIVQKVRADAQAHATAANG
jgi:subtilisin